LDPAETGRVDLGAGVTIAFLLPSEGRDAALGRGYVRDLFAAQHSNGGIETSQAPTERVFLRLSDTFAYHIGQM
jgi:hypothetical protein